MVARFIISFGPNQSYYFSNKQKNRWRNVPEGLGKFLKDDTRFSPEKVTCVSLGPSKAYFIKSSVACAWGNIPRPVESRVEELGGWDSIQEIIFTPDPERYLIQNTKGEIFGSNLSQEINDVLLRYAIFGFKELTLGVEGGYVLFSKSNMVTYKGMPEEFANAWKSGSVSSVTTSAFDRFYFIEFEDGRSVYWCPETWHSDIDELRNTAPKPAKASSPANIQANAELERARQKMGAASLGSMATGYDKNGRIVYGA